MRGIWIPARFFVGATACGHLAGRPRVYRVRNEGGKEYALQVASETVRVSHALKVATGAVRVSHGAATDVVVASANAAHSFMLSYSSDD